MRNGQQKRMRGRNRRGQNPLTRVYESNGPDVKIRGTAAHIAEKYVQLARDSQTSGDHVSAENYLQHAEHYFRVIAAAQTQFQQTQGFAQRPDQEARDDFDDDDEPMMPGLTHPGMARLHEPQEQPPPPPPRAFQPQPPREPRYADQQPRYPDQQQPRYPDQPPPRYAEPQPVANDGEEQPAYSGLPSFITGGGQQPASGVYDAANNGGDREGRNNFRRRRRHRFPPRADQAGSGEPGDAGTDSAPSGDTPTA